MAELNAAFANPLKQLSKPEFLRAWCALAFVYPGFHPDSVDEPDNGWPPRIRRFAREAWRRASACELSPEQLYPSDATWAGLYDRMERHTAEEFERREQLRLGKRP
jgi:hypothetical protein